MTLEAVKERHRALVERDWLAIAEEVIETKWPKGDVSFLDSKVLLVVVMLNISVPLHCNLVAGVLSYWDIFWTCCSVTCTETIDFAPSRLLTRLT